MKFLCLIVVVALAASAQAKAVSQDESLQKAVAGHLNDFAADFYQTLAQSQRGNLVSSPLSVSMVLAMLEKGASGSTAAQLQSALHQESNADTTDKGYRSLVESLNKPGKVAVSLANKLFVDKNIKLKEKYQELAEDIFDSEVENVNFAQAVKAAKTINDWAAEATNDKIKDILKPDDLNGAVAVIANAVYFKGAWLKPFNKKATKKLDFHLTSQDTEEVDTMVVKDTFSYGIVPHVKAHFVELPYKYDPQGDKYSFLIVIPDEIDGLADVEAELKNVKLSELRGAYQKLQLFMPKFKVESELDLKEILQQLGVTDIFKPSGDLKEISNVPLMITKMLQKAYIRVDESGTEAAAVTVGVGAITAPMVPVPPVPVKVDRPFYYAIVHQQSKAVLFQGRIVSPKI